MSITNQVAEFIAGCPFLQEFQEMFPVVNVDMLEEDVTAYSIESTPAEPILKRYANGDTVRQYVFSLCSRVLSETKKTGTHRNSMRNLRIGWMSARNQVLCRN